MLLLTSVQQADLFIRPEDKKGNPAPVDGVPEWSVSDPTVLDLLTAADGLSALVVAKGPAGTAQVNVSADADVGPGFVTIAGVLDIEVRPAQAVSLSVSHGPATDQP
jgi:hypothetical protein